MHHSISRWLIMVTAVLLLGTGCSISFSSNKTVDGGVWRSDDQGETWQQKVAITAIEGKKATTISAINIRSIVLDPANHETVYAMTDGQGIYRSTSAGDSWDLLERLPAAVTAANTFVIQPDDPCVMYLTAGNKVFKKPSCDADWQQIYFGPAEEVLTNLAIDWYNPAVLYAGTASGAVLQSTDSGVSWQSVLQVKKSRIEKILVDSRDSRALYVATENKGLYRSRDRGANWEQYLDPLKKFNGGPNYRGLALSPAEPYSLVWASDYGLLKTTDGGATWTAIPLLTAPGTALIRALAVDPHDARGIYYATDGTLYRSLDGGQNWIAAKSPSTRTITAMTVDVVNKNVIYLGVSKLSEKKGL